MDMFVMFFMAAMFAFLPEVSKVEGALGEGKEVLLLQVVEHQHIARHVCCVRCLLVDEIGGEN